MTARSASLVKPLLDDLEEIPKMIRFLMPQALLTALLLCLTAATLDAQELRGQTTTTGPDVTILNLDGLSNDGADGEYRGFSVGTDSCNVGDKPLNWCDNFPNCGPLSPAQHPVIAGNLYRVKEGRLEQLGKSWLKHGFFATNSFDSACGDSSNPDNPPNCTDPPEGFNQLGVGCTDLYGPGLNGSRELGMRYEVNAATGVFPFPETLMPFSGNVDQRIRVHQDDLNPDLNSGARYFFESQYISDNDATAETNGVSNAFNNASYREATVNSSLSMSFSGSTVRERSAIHAWQAVDPSVEIVNADFVGASGVQERFEVARKITQSDGTYTTVLAIRNMNSDQAARSLTVSFGKGNAGLSSPTFHAVENHSGEIASGEGGDVLKTEDWANAVAANSVSWTTDDFATDPAANALRWGTTFTFSFDSTTHPDDALYEIGLYKSGAVTSVTIPLGDFLIFGDGFESGSTGSWSDTDP